MLLTVFFLTKGADKKTFTELIDETAIKTGNIKMIHPIIRHAIDSTFSFKRDR
jgi:hypothetical protein